MQCATSTARYENGKVIGPQASVTLEEIAAAWYHRPDRLPPDVDLGGLVDREEVRGGGGDGADVEGNQNEQSFHSIQPGQVI